MAIVDYVVFPNATSGTTWIVDSTPPASADIAVGDVVTLACWFRIPSAAFPVTQRAMTGTRGTSGTATGLIIDIGATSDTPRMLTDSGPSNVILNWSSTISAGIWYHAIAIVNRTTGTVNGWLANTAYLIINDGTPVSAAASAAHATYTAQHLSIGGRDSTTQRLFGDVAIAEMYKSTPTAGQISSAFNAGYGSSLGLSGAVYVFDPEVLDASSLPSLPASYTDPQGNGWLIGSAVTGVRAPSPDVVATATTVPTPVVLVAPIVTPFTVSVVSSIDSPLIAAAALVTPPTVATVADLPSAVIAGPPVGPAELATTTSLPTPTVSAGAVKTAATFTITGSLDTATIAAAVILTSVDTTTDLPSPSIVLVSSPTWEYIEAGIVPIIGAEHVRTGG